MTRRDFLVKTVGALAAGAVAVKAVSALSKPATTTLTSTATSEFKGDVTHVIKVWNMGTVEQTVTFGAPGQPVAVVALAPGAAHVLALPTHLIGPQFLIRPADMPMRATCYRLRGA